MPNNRRADLWKSLAQKAGDQEITPNKEAKLMPLALIDPNPWQPRQHFDQARLEELIDDIRTHGILQPLVVRPIEGDRYQVVAGERRYRAAHEAKLATVPVVVKEGLTEQEARTIALVENLQREDLDIEDEARFLKALRDQGFSLREVADAIHKSHNYVNRRLKLLENPDALLAYRQGRYNLNNLLASRDDAPVDLAPADLTAEQSVLLGTSASDTYETVPPGNSAGRNGVEEVRFIRSTSTYKPFQKLQVYVRRLQPTEIPPAERVGLRKTITELIGELTTLQAQLVGEETNVTP